MYHNSEQPPKMEYQDHGSVISPDHCMQKQIDQLCNINLGEIEREDFLMSELSQKIQEINYRVQNLRSMSTELRSAMEKKNDPGVLRVENIKVMQREHSDVSKVGNKLKALCSKVLLLQKSNTKMNYVHLHPPYTERIKAHHQEVLIQGQREEKICPQLEKLKKKFKITHPEFIGFYRHHCTDLLPIAVNRQIVFYVNFYNENLLFFNGDPLRFNANLLFCPILLEQKIVNFRRDWTISIADQYLNEIKADNAAWEHFCFYLIFREERELNCVEHSVRIQACKEERQIAEDERDWVAVLLKKIRGYVYMKTIWTWMSYIMEQTNQKKNVNAIAIKLDEHLTFQLTTVNPRHAAKDPKIRNKADLQLVRSKSAEKPIRRDSTSEGLRDEQFQKIVTREFLSFFSAASMRKINPRKTLPAKEWALHVKYMLKHVYRRADSKLRGMGEYKELSKYYYNETTRVEL